jgi:hypothetical protein
LGPASFFPDLVQRSNIVSIDLPLKAFVLERYVFVCMTRAAFEKLF